jgi:hypothetical protein
MLATDTPLLGQGACVPKHSGVLPRGRLLRKQCGLFRLSDVSILVGCSCHTFNMLEAGGQLFPVILGGR